MGVGAAAGAQRFSCIKDCGDGFDFYQLILAAAATLGSVAVTHV
jgi:hypothetical protein